MMKRLLIKYGIINLFLLFCFGCDSDKSGLRKHYNSSDNLKQIRDKIVEVKLDGPDISNFGNPYILNEYLIISDHQSLDSLIHIYDKHTFRYLKSCGVRGMGPQEITNMGNIVPNEEERTFFVIDHGKQKILSYAIDSVLEPPHYLFKEKVGMKKTEFPNNFQYVNDTLSYASFIKVISNSDYKPVTAKWNMMTGDIDFMDYLGHPEIQKKRVTSVASIANGIYVEAYWYHDLLSICSLDGELMCNLYGAKWDNKTSNVNEYYTDVVFCDNKIIASYLGGKRMSEKENRANYPTYLIVFTIEGEHVMTLDVGLPILSFCYDDENKRLILVCDDETQIAYIDMNEILGFTS